MKFYVAAVRDWPENRMQEAFDHVTEIGSGLSFLTRDYKTIRGLVRYRIREHVLYHSHVWAVFRVVGDKDIFLGLEYNEFDKGLREIAGRYMRVRNRLGHNPNRHSGHPLGVRTG